MCLCRVFVACVLFGCLLMPMLLPVGAALQAPSTVFAEADRIAGLALNTLMLAAIASSIAVPLGVFVALVLERVRVPGAGVLRVLVLIGLFVPLPIYAVAWQVILGTWLPPLSLAPGDVAWRPWSQGLLPAGWVHGMAGLPWVVWIVSAGLRKADRVLEEDAMLTGGPKAVLRNVLLPRAMLAAIVAWGWVVVQAATEIPVTDAMMVRTFAEEVYTQLVGATDGYASAVIVVVPAWIAAVGIGGALIQRIDRLFGQAPTEAGRTVELRLTKTQQFPCIVAVWLLVLLMAALPFVALLWKAGGGSSRVGWDAVTMLAELRKVVRTDGTVLALSLLSALSSGVIAADLAWLAAWLACHSRWFGRGLFALCVILAVTPGPLVGLGLKEAIGQLLDAEEWAMNQSGVTLEFPPLRSALYDQPSPVPVMWAAVMRLFPVAVVILWPALRAIPRDLLDAAKLDGFGMIGEWRYVVIPFTAPAFVQAVLAVTALSLGEVSAGKLVNPPFRPAYILRLFDQMHYGTDSTVAALCLLQIGVTVLIALLLMAAFRPPKS